MDAIDSNSRLGSDDDDDDDDNLGTNVNDLSSPKDVREYDAQRDPTLAENVGVLILLLHSETRIFYIQYSSALSNGNISKLLSSVSELSSPCTLFPLT